MEQEKIQFSVTVGEKDLRSFLVYHTYRSMQGIASVLISIFALAILVLRWQELDIKLKVLLAVIGLLYLVYTPIRLRFRAKIQAASEVFSRPLNFEFSEEEIKVYQGEEEAVVPWENIYKIVSRRHALFLYTNRIYAYIIPKEQAGDAWKKALAMADRRHCRITS